jgi:hypothetical protein
MTDEQTIRIIEAISRLRQDFMTALNEGLASVNLAIAQLHEKHNATVLEQERRNATFADRARVELIAEHVHDHTASLNEQRDRLTRLETAVQEVSGLDRRLDELAGRELPPHVRTWAEAAERVHASHEETRAHIMRQVATYVVIALTGVMLSALGFSQIAHQVAHAIGGH